MPALRGCARGRRIGACARNVPARFRVLRDERIQPILREARPVVARMGVGRPERSGDKKNFGEVFCIHHSLHEKTVP